LLTTFTALFILAPALTKRLPYARFMDSTPAINWDRIVNDHFVQWYDNDDSLIRLVGEFISRDLSRQNAAIIVTTPSHRAGIEKFLDSRNLNVEVLRRSGRYIPLDAQETLDKIMVGDRPDTSKFFAVMGLAVSRACNSWNALSAFGEMVALLWEHGNRNGAIALEHLWNDLARIYPFALFCAYPKSPLVSPEEQTAIRQVCNAHSICII
jgi:hypothetical protein